MGGFFRAVRRVFSRPKPVVIQQPVVQAAPAQTAKKESRTAQSMAASKAGSYGGQTLMTEATGVEEEANVAKSVLGGESIKKKKKYA